MEIRIVLDGAVRSAFRVAAAVLALATGLMASGNDALAQGRLDARYTVTLAGIPIGKGAWVIDITDSQFTAAASGSTAGLLRVFSGGQGTGASRGGVVAGKLVPSAFAASITSDKKTEDVRMALAGGDVKDYDINPMPPPPEPERIPLNESHRRGANDPMTSLLVRVPGNGNPLGPKACERVAPVFDGRLRYNLQFAYKRMEQVKADRGYEGPVVVCSVFFTPVAGHIPTRSAIKYLEAQRDMEVWLAPMASSRTLVPYRISIPTPIGMGTLQATQFISAPPQRAAASVQ